MAVEQVVVQELPFEVGPIAPSRVKLWSRFAGQMASDADIEIASNVYSGFWYDNYVFKMYDYALAWVKGAAAGDRSSASHLVAWLGMLASGLESVVERWSRVTRGLLGQVGDVSFPRHYKDADQHIAWAVELLALVRFFVVAVCQEFGFDIPDGLLEQRPSPTVPAAGEGAESL